MALVCVTYLKRSCSFVESETNKWLQTDLMYLMSSEVCQKTISGDLGSTVEWDQIMIP